VQRHVKGEGLAAMCARHAGLQVTTLLNGAEPPSSAASAAPANGSAPPAAASAGDVAQLKQQVGALRGGECSWVMAPPALISSCFVRNLMLTL